MKNIFKKQKETSHETYTQDALQRAKSLSFDGLKIHREVRKEKIKAFLKKIKTFLKDHLFLLVKSSAENHLRIQKCKAKPEAGEVCDLAFDSYSDLKKYQKKVRLFTYSFSSTVVSVIVAAFAIQFFFATPSTLGAIYSWSQSKWDAALSVNSTGHSQDELGRTSYSSWAEKTSNLSIANPAPLNSSLSISVESSSKTQTSDASDVETGFNYSDENYSNTVLSGTGDNASLKLVEQATAATATTTNNTSNVTSSSVQGGWTYGTFSSTSKNSATGVGSSVQLTGSMIQEFVWKFGTNGAGNGQFGAGGGLMGAAPMGIALSPDGNYVYVADKVNSRIQKFTTNTTHDYVSQWGSFGTGDGQFKDLTGVATDASGNVYATEGYTNSRVQKFDANGNFLMKFGSYNGGGANGTFGIVVAGIDVDSSGNIYVADTSNNRVQKFNSSGGFVTQWGGNGTAFNSPKGIVVDPTNAYVYVSDPKNYRIQKFTTAGVFVSQFGSLGTGNGQFNSNQDGMNIAVDTDGYIYTSESNRIQKFNSDGTYVTQWGSEGCNNGQMFNSLTDSAWQLWGIAVDSSRNVYMMNNSPVCNPKLQKFSQPIVYPVSPTVGTYTSYIDGGSFSGFVWSSLAWDGTFPANTTLSIKVKGSDTTAAPSFASGTCDASSITADSSLSLTTACYSRSNRYLHYQVTFATTNQYNTPLLDSVTASFTQTNGYYSSGTYTSGVLDAARNVSDWGAATLTQALNGGTVGILFASSNNSNGPWTFKGKDGSDQTDCTQGQCYASGDNIAAVHNGNRYAKYKLFFATPDITQTPVVNATSIAFDSFPTSQYLISSPFDSYSEENVMDMISWTQGTGYPANTGVVLSLRTAATIDGLTAAPWTEIARSDTGLTAGCTGNSGSVTCPNTIIPATMRDTISDRWFQYKLTLNTEGSVAPSVDDVLVKYVVNAPPEVTVASASENSSGQVVVEYKVRDIDTSDGAMNGSVTTSLEYSIDGGSTWISASSVTGNVGASIAVAPSSNPQSDTPYYPAEGNYVLTWNAKTDFANQYYENFLVRVKAYDGEQANFNGYGNSSVFILDTKNPAPGAVPISVNAQSAPAAVTLSASDDSALQMKVSLDPILSDVSWEPYSTSKTISIPVPSGATVYAQFMDAYGNASSVQSAQVPTTPVSMMIQDVTNTVSDPDENRLFVAWKVITAPSPGFVAYKVYRSSDQNNWEQIGSNITNINTNYFSDATGNTNTYYYKVAAFDADGNVSAYSAIVSGEGDGVQNGTEIGSGFAPPVISSVMVDQITTTSARVNWTTDSIATSTVGFSTSQGVFTTEQGVGSMVTDHHVTVSGLVPNTQYYFQVKSGDANNQLSSDNNGGGGYSFTTNLGDTESPIISEINTADVTDSTATITWTTNENADSFIEYSKTDGFTKGAIFGEYVLSTSHSVTVPSLEANATYYYKIHSKDASNNEAVSVQQSFATDPSGDVNPPTIVGSIAATPSFNSSSISWETNEPATSYVEYGTTTGYGRIYGDSTLNTSHSIQLPYDLIQLTTYHYRVHSSDGSGNEFVSDDLTFTTTQNPADVTGPVIANVTVSSATRTGGTITWLTNENSTSFVAYSQDGGNTFVQQGASTSSMFHSVTLVGLSPATTYLLKIISTDASGNTTTDTKGGQYHTLVTANGPQAPSLLNIASGSITYNSATISWNTNVNATSMVEYGLDTNYGSVHGKLATTKNHSIILNNLLPNAEYHFRVRSTEEIEGVSGDYTFTTSVAPDTTPANITVTGTDVTSSGATITWVTTEDTNTVIQYGITTAYDKLSGNKNDSAQTHSVTLSNLEPSTTYHYQIEAKDGAGNIAQTTDATFTTTADLSTPAISNITELTTQTSTLIAWETSKDTDTFLEYSLDTSYGMSVEDMQMFGKQHFLSLTGLSKGTTYNYRITATDIYGNDAAEEGTFTTAQDASLDHPPLASGDIKNINVPDANLTDRGAVITFTTEQVALCYASASTVVDGQVALVEAKENGYDAVENYNKAHAIILSGLRASATYVFSLNCHDNIIGDSQATDLKVKYPNWATSSDGSFTTKELMNTQTGWGADLGIDNEPPVIANVKVSDTVGESATVTWDTNEETNSIVRYGLSSVDEYITGDSVVNKSANNYTASHSVVVRGLIPASKYVFVVASADAAGNISESSQSSFTTAAPSSLSSIRAESKALGEATITWKTDKTTTSTVEYGLSTSYGEKKESSTLTKEHLINLSGLELGTTYHFRVRGKDEDNILYASSDQTFEPKSPPQILDIAINEITEHEATVSFKTNVPTTATAQYINTKDQTDNGAQSDGDMKAQHSIKLKNLSQGTTFALKIQVTDEQGTQNEESGKDFTTGRDENPPKIDQVHTDAALTQSDKVQAIISWKTDEQSDTALVYKEGKNGAEKEIRISDNLATNHVAVVTVFKPGTVYYFKVKSADASKNIGTSSDFALLTPRRKENIIQIIVNNFQDIFGWARR